MGSALITNELITVAKFWTLDLLWKTFSGPAFSILSQVTQTLPFVGSWLEGIVPVTPARPGLESIPFYLKEIEAFAQSQERQKEREILGRFKARLAHRRDETEKQLAFLAEFYQHVLDLNPSMDEPRQQITDLLMRHYEKDKLLAAAIGIRPAHLDRMLEEKEKAMLSERHPSPVLMQIPIPEVKRLETTTELPPRRRLERAATVVVAKPILPDLSDIVNPEETLARYKAACDEYSLHLLADILDEIEECQTLKPQHALFKALEIPEEKSARCDRLQIAKVLLNDYDPTIKTQELRLFTQADLRQKRKAIDTAISSTRLQFNLGWQKYKIIKQLSVARSVSDFHQILAEDENRKTLTTLRTGRLMRFVKQCGLGVATILGLPLAIVGGYLLAHRSLFGSRSTDGQLFLQKIDRLTKAGKNPGRSGLKFP